MLFVVVAAGWCLLLLLCVGVVARCSCRCAVLFAVCCFACVLLSGVCGGCLVGAAAAGLYLRYCPLLIAKCCALLFVVCGCCVLLCDAGVIVVV